MRVNSSGPFCSWEVKEVFNWTQPLYPDFFKDAFASYQLTEKEKEILQPLAEFLQQNIITLIEAQCLRPHHYVGGRYRTWFRREDALAKLSFIFERREDTLAKLSPEQQNVNSSTSILLHPEFDIQELIGRFQKEIDTYKKVSEENENFPSYVSKCLKEIENSSDQDR